MVVCELRPCLALGEFHPTEKLLTVPTGPQWKRRGPHIRGLRAADNALLGEASRAARKGPAGRRLPTPDLNEYLDRHTLIQNQSFYRN